MKKIRLLGACAVTLTIITSSEANIINGGFETGDLTGWSGSGNLAVWSLDVCCAPSEGQYYVNFNSSDSEPNGQISQTFTTVVGTKYLVEFDFAKGGIRGGTAALNTVVTGGTTLLDEVVSDSTGGQPGEYSSFTFSFIADSTDSTLMFIDSSVGTVSFDALLDRVVVNVVPIPPAVWLFGSGLIGLIGIARRKKV